MYWMHWFYTWPDGTDYGEYRAVHDVGEMADVMAKELGWPLTIEDMIVEDAQGKALIRGIGPDL